jgi:hypothetical protein
MTLLCKRGGIVFDPARHVYATPGQSWDLRGVDATGVVGVGGDDTFGLYSIIAWNLNLNFQNHIRSTTYRCYDIAGVATFHPNSAESESRSIGVRLSFGTTSGLAVELTD